jgi:glucose/arabinose dehydrogenase
VGLFAAPAAAQVEPRVFIADLSFPAGIAFADDGTMYFTERAGSVRVVRDGRLAENPIARIETTDAAEMGLLGITVEDGDDPAIYVFATDPSGATNRVVRIGPDGGDPEIILDGLAASGYHNGGGVAFFDGHLYVSHGETHDSSRAQDPETLGGKVYRLLPDGSVPDDNPFGDSPAFAIGLRNPFGLAIDPITGLPFVTENGPESHDQVERLVPGGNYGWPEVSGPAPSGFDSDALTGDYHDPLLDYPEIIIPTGIAIAHPRNAQKRFAGDLFFGSYGEGAIHHVELNEARDEAVSDEIFVDEEEPVIAVAWGPQGLYYSTPSAIKLVPIARDAGAQGSRGSPSVPPPVGAEDEPESATSRWLGAAALIVVAAVLAYSVWRVTRRGRA